MLHPRPLNKHQITHAALVALVISLFSGPSLAGRPLAVDDANVNDVGAGHVETWLNRHADSTNMWNVATAYGLADGMEVGLTLAGGASSELATTVLQAKFQLTPAVSNGCNFGTSLGVSQPHNGGANTPFVNGLLSCNAEFGSVHINAGANRPPEGPTLATWGIAVERGFGAHTAHLEAFGQEQTSPTVQVGWRTDVAKNVQLDATLGRASSETVLSLGMKFQF